MVISDKIIIACLYIIVNYCAITTVILLGLIMFNKIMIKNDNHYVKFCVVYLHEFLSMLWTKIIWHKNCIINDKTVKQIYYVILYHIVLKLFNIIKKIILHQKWIIFHKYLYVIIINYCYHVVKKITYT